MDRLDKISILAIAVLLIGVFVVMQKHEGDADPRLGQHHGAQVAETPVLSTELDTKVKIIKSLIEKETLAQADSVIAELKRSFPYHGEPYMLTGDLFMRRQEPVKAMQEYRQAIDLNPDYLDKKTPFFQGRKLKIAAGEALADVEKKLRLKPDDESLLIERRVIYYLYRKIAGSCG